MSSLVLLSLLLGQTFDLDPTVVKIPQEIFKVPVIVYVNDINEEAARQFDEDMRVAKGTGQPIIPIVIDSYGGSVYSLLSMVDTIQHIGVPVATVVKGKAMSAGAVLLTCGAEGMRFAAPNSTILIHDVSSMMDGKMADLEVEVDEVKRLNKLLFTTMARNVRKPDNYFSDLVAKRGRTDLYLTPKEALAHGIVNQIKLPELKTKVSLTTTLE